MKLSDGKFNMDAQRKNMDDEFEGEDEYPIEESTFCGYEKKIQRKQEKEEKRKKAVRAMRLVRKQGGL